MRALRSCTILVAAAWLAVVAWGSDQVPAPPQTRPVALTGGTVHPVDGAPLAGATILFDQGKITALGVDVAVPADAEVIDITGKHVYPGFIACGTQLGLIEIDQVRASRDQSEVGDLNPNVRAELSVNPDSELIPVARANGVALAVTRPTGGLISGSSALLRLDGWTYEDLVVRAPLGIHIEWPPIHVHVPGDSDATDRRRRSRDAQLAAIRDMFEEARAYRRGRERDAAGEPDLRLEALIPCLAGEVPVFLHANEERQILSALHFAREFGLRPVVIGGYDTPRITQRLVEWKVAVIYGPVHRLPLRRDDPHDTPFIGPRLLHEAGVEFAIASFETSNVRNLPYNAATAAAHGLPREQALAALTAAPARILGVDDRLGTLTVGKDATLIVTDGDPLEVTTQVERMFIEGRAIDLSSRHTQLYEKYKKRLERP